MKVLIVTTDIDHIEPYQFVGAKRNGAEVAVICDRGARNLEIFFESSINVEKLEFASRRHAPTIAAIKKRVQEFAPDIVHVLRKKALSNTIPALSGSNVKLIAYRGIVGNLSFLDPVSWMTFLNPRVDRIVCVAEAIRQHFLTMGFGPLRVDPGKVVTIHKGHQTERYEGIAQIDLSIYGIAAGNRVIACIASMRPRKGVPILIEAFSKMNTDDVALMLVGEVKDPRVQKAIDASPRRKNIFLTGSVSQQDALRVAGSVDVITMPSIKREGLPRAVIEAMAQGTPAVVTDIGGSPELIESGISGLVVPPRDVRALAVALDKILCRDTLAQMGEGARQRIYKDFHVAQTIEKNWALYNQLLAE